MAYICDTYYTPPRNERSRLQVFIYQKPSPEADSQSNSSYQQQNYPSLNANSVEESTFLTDSKYMGNLKDLLNL